MNDDFYINLAKQFISNGYFEINGNIVFIWNEDNTEIKEIRVVGIENLKIDTNYEYDLFIKRRELIPL